MINILNDFNIDTDLSVSISSKNNMQLVINYTYFKDIHDDVTNNNKPINIAFQSDINYAINVSIYLTKSGKLIIDEPFDDQFYYPSVIADNVDKICWFTIPANYSDVNGLNNIDIYVKGGNE